MNGVPPIGTTGEQRFVVEAKHAIDFATGGMPAVLCTPWLVWFLEHAARAAVLPFLEPDESTVGARGTRRMPVIRAEPFAKRVKDKAAARLTAVKEQLSEPCEKGGELHSLA